jgi:hypothetical protein
MAQLCSNVPLRRHRRNSSNPNRVNNSRRQYAPQQQQANPQGSGIQRDDTVRQRIASSYQLPRTAR